MWCSPSRHCASDSRSPRPVPCRARPRSETEAAQLLGVALPLFGDLDVQVEVHLRAEQCLELFTGLCPDLAQPLTLVPEDDALLAVALDVEERVDVDHVVAALMREH